MKKTTDRLYVWGFVSILGIMSLAFFIMPKETFSEMENRTLQKTPELTWDRVVSNEFAKDTESFISDHFPFRTEWVATKSMLEQLRLQKENNGIFKGEDGYLFEKFQEPDYEELQKYVDAVNKFGSNHPDAKVSFMLSPTSVGVLSEKLPWLASVYPQHKVNDYIEDRVDANMSFLNGFDFLNPASTNDEKPIFYKTDHHWTTYGAYLAYRAYAEEMGWKPLSEADFNIFTVTDSFLGSYHTRGQFGATKPDYIEVYEPKVPVETSMYIADSDKTVTSLYDASFLGKKDKYSYFQGGVHALMKLTNGIDQQAVDLNKLLIVKDSYAHSMLPFLTNHVEEIHMIDIRFYNGNISDYMEQNRIDDVLLLFNTSTFVGERNLLKLKY
ncbi:DHHW family protein [Paenibacillus sp. L3-i20]|uniref:DHHW family protein n=1 Tax=Paenibacillus sp. L3-i20 TaxID=2905833 RepID=UPI001EDE2352|nr:DHHW family protein [Paenibacillus sp. L3-i20]GKU80457.1 membrane protein [Paenibacillus sp. L3-i20]